MSAVAFAGTQRLRGGPRECSPSPSGPSRAMKSKRLVLKERDHADVFWFGFSLEWFASRGLKEAVAREGITGLRFERTRRVA